MVDRVVLVALDESQQVRDLDGHPPRVGHEGSQPLGEVDDVGHVGEDVVGDDEVGRAVDGPRSLTPDLLAQERDLGRDALVHRGLGDVRGGLDAEAADAAGDDVLEQVAVVARHLDDEGARAQPQPVHRLVDEPLRVGDP